MRTKNQLTSGVLGRKAEIVSSGHSLYLGISGVVVEETQNTLTFRTVDGTKQVPKKGIRLRVELDEGKTEIEGAELQGRPADRIKQRKI